MQTQVAKHNCRVCIALEHQYEAAVAKIRSVVSGRSSSIGEKILALHAAQDQRDAVLRALNEHKRQQAEKKSASNRKTPGGDGFPPLERAS